MTMKDSISSKKKINEAKINLPVKNRPNVSLFYRVYFLFCFFFFFRYLGVGGRLGRGNYLNCINRFLLDYSYIFEQS